MPFEGTLEWKRKKMGFYSWHRVKAILLDGVFSLLSREEGHIEGQISMKIATFAKSGGSEEPGFTIHSGIKAHHFRTETQELALKWLDQLQKAKAALACETKRIEAFRAGLNSRPMPSEEELRELIDDSLIKNYRSRLSTISHVQTDLCERLSSIYGVHVKSCQDLAEQMKKETYSLIKLFHKSIADLQLV